MKIEVGGDRASERSDSRRGRVAESHYIARSAFVAALFFAMVAVGWSVYVLVSGGSWWGPLHAFVAGTVLLAISGASQMFTITWSSTVPPSRRLVQVQRWLLVIGIGFVLVGVGLDVSVLVWLGGGAAVAAIVVLGWIIVSAVRKSLLKRFDLSARFYLAAFSAGVLGIILGTLMGAGAANDLLPSYRLVHSHLNLVGLVGLTILGTLPTLLPTTAYHKAVSGLEAKVGFWVSALGLGAITGGLWLPRMVGVGTILVSLGGLMILSGIVYRLWDKGRHKTTFLMIAIGSVWLIAWGFTHGTSVASSGAMTHFGGWTGAVVLAGVGQVLAGSLSYLIPVLNGAPFVANRKIMEARPWLPMTTVNIAAVLLGVGVPAAGVILVAIWVGDFAIRVGRVVWGNPENDEAISPASVRPR